MVRALLPFLLLCALTTSCRNRDLPNPAPRARLWHTFQPHETEALNEIVADRVETGLVPLHRGLVILESELRAGRDCPDVVRIDSSWLLPLQEAGLLEEIPAGVFARWAWLPEAEELVRVGGLPFALPQSIDGLVLVHRPLPPGFLWPPSSLEDLRTVASSLGAGSVSMRVDGYWFVPFLRAEGVELFDRRGPFGGQEARAARAVDRFAGWFAPGGPSLVLPLGEEEREEKQRFRSGKTQIVVTGPWSFYELSAGAPDTLLVAPMPDTLAPRGGSLFAVPRCAPSKERGFALAVELTDPALQARWAERFGTVPSTRQGLAAAPSRVKTVYRALSEHARPMPRLPIVASLFDDLTPALVAVISASATAEEVLPGVARAWQRLAGKGPP